ncbi:hypothetical protein [Lacrimispora sp.]|jgi:uncharacterized membrane protein YqjE|uniref:hypothetical protein n=1 Tax=Lacrimispora sp. TaxID=2719234 RepID=UPI00289E96D1|nr:hypothetical protein [Lacrimispora sp.]
MSEKKGSSNPPQSTLILRLVGGGYLVYLGYQMITELSMSSGVRNLVQVAAMVIFLVVGILLVGWSVKKLLRREYVRPGEEETDRTKGDNEEN